MAPYVQNFSIALVAHFVRYVFGRLETLCIWFVDLLNAVLAIKKELFTVK